jgi:hypothetical protein
VICFFRSLFSLLLPAVFRCSFETAGFRQPEFLRLSEVRPLYFPGFISGISAQHPIGETEKVRTG